MAEAAMHTVFGSILQPGQARGEGRGRFVGVLLLAVGLHAAALLCLAVLASRPSGPVSSGGAGGGQGEIAVRFMTARALAPAVPSAPRAQPASRPAPVRRRKSVPPPVLTARAAASAETPVVQRETAGEQGTEEAPEVASAESVPAGSGGGGASGVSGGIGGSFHAEGGLMPPPPPPSLSREQRQSLTSRYLQELFRNRIAARFQYPPDAEHLGLEGLVLVRVSIDASGQLVGIRVQGACPHSVLCDAALRTVRASVPFPPPPSELGGSITVDVPFQYRLE